MRSVYVFPAVNREGTNYANTTLGFHGKKLVRDAYFMFMFDGRQAHRFVDMLSNEDCIDYPADALRMQCTVQLDRNPISPAQVIKLRKTGHISIMFVYMKECS